MEQPQPNITNRSAVANQGDAKKLISELIQKLLKITENYTNQDGEELTFKYLQEFKVAYQ